MCNLKPKFQRNDFFSNMSIASLNIHFACIINVFILDPVLAKDLLSNNLTHCYFSPGNYTLCDRNSTGSHLCYLDRFYERVGICGE